MLKNTRKYFLFPLALLLVLSNFSFATSLMICGMSEMDTKCSCSHNIEPVSSGLQFNDADNKSCCENRIIELNNANILQKLNEEVNKSVLLSSLFNNVIIDDTFASFSKSFFEVNKPPPKLLNDIPITNSSLRI